MKKSLLSAIVGASLIGNLQAATYDFSYVDEVVEYLGIQAAETYDVAVYIPGNLFEGYHLKQVNAQIHATAKDVPDYSEPSLWLSSSLRLNGKTFTPDVASYPVELQNDGTLTTTLPEDYVITDAGVYVGYTVTVKKLSSTTKYPMAVGVSNNPNALFCRTSKNMPEWSSLSVDMGYGAAISMVLEKDVVPAESVAISYLQNPIYLEIGKQSSVNVELASFASEPVKSVDIEYNIEGNKSTQHFEFENEVPAGLYKQFDVTLDLPALADKISGDYTFEVSKVNGKANNSALSKATTFIASFGKVPAHQTLIEEYTGTWCGYCTRGYAALEYIKKNEPDFVVAAFHNNTNGADAMAITSNYPSAVSGFPCVYLDRFYTGDPYYGTGGYSGKIPIVEEVKALNAQVTPWGIEVSHTWEGDDTLVATANVWNLLGFEHGKYEIAYLLVADGLTGSTNSWIQSNYLNTNKQSPDVVEELNQFYKGGIYGTAKVKGLVFNDVVISTTGIYGVEGSIPSSLAAEEKATHSITFDLSKIKSTLLPDKNKLRVIAAVLDSNGYVMNCAKNEVNDFVATGVEDVVEDANAPVEYYDLTGRRVDNPTKGIYIKKVGNRTQKIML